MTLDHALPGGPLTAADLEALARGFISAELAERALLRRVSAIDGAQIVGQKEAKFAGIVFPYVMPGSTVTALYRLRRDTPDVEYKHGQKSELRKYLAPKEARNRLYFVPGTDPELVTDVDLPLCFTEGEKKAIALWRLAVEVGAGKLAFLPVGLSGVTNWRGTIGKETNASGERAAVKGPLPELENLPVKGRRVYIAFDRDVAVNWQVRYERYKFAQYLLERGAQVRFVEIPADSEHKGIDDLLGAVGPAPVWQLFETASIAGAFQEACALIESIKESHNSKLLFESAALFAQMGVADLSEIKAKIRRDLKAEKISIKDFEHTINTARARIRREQRDEKPDDLRYQGQEYQATSKGLVWWKPVREGGRSPVYLCNFGAEIVADVVRDDGEETTRALKIRVNLKNQTTDVTVTAAEFAAMAWPIESLGAYANVFPNYRDHTRSAIQQLSTDIREQYVYQHTGWTTIKGEHVYLHAGGGIGPEGVIDVEVDLERALRHFELPTPPEGDELGGAIRQSLGMLYVAPASVMFPLYSAVWRAILGQVNVSVFLSGQTGSGKSQLAALAQQHFGAGMNALNLPAGWESTANALEALSFKVKNALLTIDDFVPKGSSADISRLHMMADRLFRSQGNHTGRGRMHADTRLRAPKNPRGLILATGEDVPKGHSLRGRLVMLELDGEHMDWQHLTICQRQAATGAYAAAAAGFIRWLAPKMSAMDQTVAEYLEQMRKQITGKHKRTPDNIANLALGFRMFLEFAVETGAIAEETAADLMAENWRAYDVIIDQQDREQETDEPCQKFLALIVASLRSGVVHMTCAASGVPPNSENWGWTEGKPAGSWIGWVDGDEVFLDPEISYAAAQRFARDSGTYLPVAVTTLTKRLSQRKMLLTTDKSRGTATIRRSFRGIEHKVLHFSLDALLSRATTRQTRHLWSEGAESGEGTAKCRVPEIGVGLPLKTRPDNPDTPNYLNSQSSNGQKGANVGFVGFPPDIRGRQRGRRKSGVGFDGSGCVETPNTQPDTAESEVLL